MNEETASATSVRDSPLAQFNVDRESVAPLHEQISTAIRSEIVAGIWPAHTRLPAEPVLASSLAVSRGTLRRALKTLIDAGLLVQARGRGTFVSPTAISQPIAQELVSLAEGLEREGIAFETEVLSAAVRTRTERPADLLQLGEDELLFEIERRRRIEGEPVAVLHNYIRRQFCPGIEANDFRRQTVFGLLEKVYGLQIATGRRTFEAQGASAEIAGQLEIDPGTPVLYLEQLTYLDGDEPIEYSDVWIRGDRLKLTTILSRRPPR